MFIVSDGIDEYRQSIPKVKLKVLK